jgi:hypothetical protein
VIAVTVSASTPTYIEYVVIDIKISNQAHARQPAFHPVHDKPEITASGSPAPNE